MVTHPFAPVVDENCRTLILGSFPSVKSRENGFYYGHPQNRFWRMLAAVYAEDVPESIAEKISLLLRHHLALWDVIANCEIDGSADASVREAVPVDIEYKYDIVFSCAETAHRSASDFLSDSAGTGILPHDCAADPAKKGVLLCLRSC